MWGMGRTLTLMAPMAKSSVPSRSWKRKVASELGHVDGEEGRPHHRGQGLLQRAALLGGTVDVEDGAGVPHRARRTGGPSTWS